MEQSVPHAAEASDPAAVSPEREWLSAHEVAELVRVSQRRVHQAVRRGELRAAVVDARGRIVVHRNWLRQWIESLADRGALAKQSEGRSSVVREFKVPAVGDRNDDGNGGAAA